MSSDFLSGVVTSRTCPLCGHHEVGLATSDGTFIPLKPGMAIRIGIGEPSPPHHSPIIEIPGRGTAPAEDGTEYVAWVPEPVMSNRSLRLKYGVRVAPEHAGKMSPEIYRLAYLEKLKELTGKEVYIPLPVILDRFFTAPHLASGNPRQIAEAMWRDLKEVREPFLRVKNWMENGDASIFEEHGRDASKGDAGEEPGRESLSSELQELSLEDFLGLL